jgi:hypothetical protein
MYTRSEVVKIKSIDQNKIVNFIEENFRGKTFCAYDVFTKIRNPDETLDKKTYHRYLVAISKAIKRMMEEKKLVFVGYKEGKGPIMKKMYKLVE